MMTIREATVALLGCLGLAASPQEDAKKAVEDFKAGLKAAQSPDEKARVVLSLGAAEPKDPLMVPALALALAPTPADPYLRVPSSAVEALAGFRGMAAASRALISAAETYKRVPYLHRKLVLAIGRVGHPGALAYFDLSLGGVDPASAALALQAIARMPAPAAVEKLLSEHERMTRSLKNAKETQKRVYERCLPDIEELVMKLTAQPYPTFEEHRLWWSKQTPAFKKDWEERERVTRPSRPDPLAPLIVELLFNEEGGTSTSNSGSLGAWIPSATLTASGPGWTQVTAPSGGPRALEWDRQGGNQAVDLGGAGARLTALGQLSSFTVTGWILRADAREASGTPECGGGQRVLSWLHPDKLDGVDVVARADGSLQVGINEWAESSPLRSSAGRIRVYDAKAADSGAERFRTWCFFAVTYDSTLKSGHAKLYLGWPGGDVQLASTLDHDRGRVGPFVASHLTIGNVVPRIRPRAPGRSFRGIIDDVRIFGSGHDGLGALPVDELMRIQAR